MHILQELAQYLDNENMGTYSPTGVDGNIFINFLPVSPDEVIGLFLYGGQNIITTNNPGCKFDKLLVQIYVRGVPEDSLTSMVTAKNIYNLLVGYHHKAFIDGGKFILNVRPNQSEPVFLDRDDNLRFSYVVNLTIEYQNVERLH